MLTQLTVNNFAIVKFLELDLQPGMTCITGETRRRQIHRH